MHRLLAVAALALPLLHGQGTRAENEWQSWGRGTGNRRFSTLKQINAGNVSKLVPTWQFDMKKEGVAGRPSQSNATGGGWRHVLFVAVPIYI